MILSADLSHKPLSILSVWSFSESCPSAVVFSDTPLYNAQMGAFKLALFTYEI